MINLPSLDIPITALIQEITETAQLAGAMIKEPFGEPRTIESKGGRDFVTEVDLEAETLIRSELTDRIPMLSIVGEEHGGTAGPGLTAYIDPIDGTSNFIDGIPFYCVSIGIADEHRLVAGVVYDPEREETFTAIPGEARLNGELLHCRNQRSDEFASITMTWPYEGINVSKQELLMEADLLASFRSVRRLGSAALGLAYVAAGRVDLASELAAHPWDVAAGFLLVESAGGIVTRAAGPSENKDEPWFSPRYVAHGAGFDIASSRANVIFK